MAQDDIDDIGLIEGILLINTKSETDTDKELSNSDNRKCESESEEDRITEIASNRNK